MSSNENAKPAESWAEELRELKGRLKETHPSIHIEKTYLAPEWEKDRWQSLRNEWDRILFLKTELGWLSIDAAARVDRRLRAAGEIIDAATEGKASEAALKLSQAEHIMQRAWWSRRWNNWRRVWRLCVPPWWLAIAVLLLAALGGTVWAIFDRELFPRGDELELPDALFAATLWGFAGALVNGLRSVHLRVQAQEFEKERLAWYLLSPIIGLAFGAIAFLLFLAGLLSTGQDLREETALTVEQASDMAKVVDPTPILVLALLAGFAQNAFIGALQQIIKARFRGAAEEEETTP